MELREATAFCSLDHGLEREYGGQNCSIASALEIVRERWALLIFPDVFLGLHR
jgi:hypothetical protein